jgi:hypothetical protein
MRQGLTVSSRVQGYLLRGYHTFYWMGLSTPQWPEWAWVDRQATAQSSYQHWGSYQLPSSGGAGAAFRLVTEPDALYDSQPLDCAGGNSSQAYSGGGAGAGLAWGWADDACSAKHIYICRQAGESTASRIPRCLRESSALSARHRGRLLPLH